MSLFHRLTGRAALIIATISVLSVLILGPLIFLVFSSFRASEGGLPFGPSSTWTLQNYVDVFLQPSTYRLLWTTFIFSFGALVVSFVGAAALAWLIERTNLPFRSTWFVLIVAAIGIPNIILAIAWGFLLNPTNGLINIYLRALFGLSGPGPLDLYTLPGMIFVQGLTLIPITYLFLAAGFRSLDSGLEEAAAASGARFDAIARRVTLPLMTPAFLAAFVYQFVAVIDSFDIPFLIGLRGGVPVLTAQIFITVVPSSGLPDYGLAASYSLLQMALAAIPMLLYVRVLSQGYRYETITGRGYQPRRVSLGRWKFPALIVVCMYVLASFVLPALILLWVSIQPYYAPPSPEALARVTLSAYWRLIQDKSVHQAVWNTVLLGLSVGAITLTLGTLVSWIVIRLRTRARLALDALSFLPQAMPGVLIGLSVLLIYISLDRWLPIPIYGTIWIIVIGLATQYIPLATRLMSAGIIQIGVELEEAAQASGASLFATMRRVVLPLVRPALANGFLLVFVATTKSLTLPLMLISRDGVVLSSLVYQHYERASAGTTGVLGVALVLIAVVAALLLRRANVQGTAMT